MLAKAIDQAGTADDVVKVAMALEGMEYDSIWGSRIYMRPEDHQAIQNVYILEHTDVPAPFHYDNSGYGLVVENKVEMASANIATTCKMKRPK